MRTSFFNLLRNLGEYTPSNRHFTSGTEVEFVKTTLELDSMSAFDLINLRDMTVMFYEMKMNDEMMNNDMMRTEKWWQMHSAMSSVTAVIDSVKFSKGLEV